MEDRQEVSHKKLAGKQAKSTKHETRSKQEEKRDDHANNSLQRILKACGENLGQLSASVALPLPV